MTSRDLRTPGFGLMITVAVGGLQFLWQLPTYEGERPNGFHSCSAEDAKVLQQSLTPGDDIPVPPCGSSDSTCLAWTWTAVDAMPHTAVFCRRQVTKASPAARLSDHSAKRELVDIAKFRTGHQTCPGR